MIEAPLAAVTEEFIFCMILFFSHIVGGILACSTSHLCFSSLRFISLWCFHSISNRFRSELLTEPLQRLLSFLFQKIFFYIEEFMVDPVLEHQ